MKNVLTWQKLNPGPFSHKSAQLTSRTPLQPIASFHEWVQVQAQWYLAISLNSHKWHQHGSLSWVNLCSDYQVSTWRVRSWSSATSAGTSARTRPTSSTTSPSHTSRWETPTLGHWQAWTEFSLKAFSLLWLNVITISILISYFCLRSWFWYALLVCVSSSTWNLITNYNSQSS